MNLTYTLLNDLNQYGLMSIYYMYLIVLILKKNKTLDNLSTDILKNKFGINSDNILNYILDKNNELEFKNVTLNDIVKFHFNNDTQLNIKEYYKYYNNKKLIKWIINLADIHDNQNILDGNVKINSFLDEVINMNVNICGYQTEKNIFDIINIHKQINNNKVNIYNNNIMIDDINPSLFDTIFLDFPHGYHNITHANCCNKIKKLRLRGTKAEPLLLQLVFSSLNKNGKAFLIVPDSLLFSDSIQSIETRKHLVKMFNVKKIVQIDEMFYELKGTKNSILYFENNGKTTNIEFSKISLVNDQVKEEPIINIPDNLFNYNSYSLYYKYYLETPPVNVENKLVSDLFDFNSNKSVGKIITLEKYYKNDSSIKISENKNDNINISCRKDNYFFILYLEHLLKTKYDQVTKGKMMQFDVNKISNLSIPILSNDKQKAVINYLEITNKIVNSNIEKISMYNELKNCLLETIPGNNLIELSEVCSFYESSTGKELLGIIKNGQLAGSVYLPETLSSNSYYLYSDTFMIKYIYYYLKFNESKLLELANRTTQANITKPVILALKIPNINIDNQKEIVDLCEKYDNDIKKYEFDNNNIKEKDIFTTILKLNNF